MARDDFDGRGRDERSRDDRYGQDSPPGREGSDERDQHGGASYGQGRGRDASRDRMDTSGRGGIGGGMGHEGGGRYAGRPEDDARTTRYGRDDYDDGFSRQGLRGGRGEGAGRDATYDRDDARYDAYGADGSQRDRGQGGTMGGSMGGNAGWREASRDWHRDAGAVQGGAFDRGDRDRGESGGGSARDHGRGGDYGRRGGASGRPGSADAPRQSGGNWFAGAHGGAPDRNPGQGFGAFGYSNADEPPARGGEGSGREFASRDHSGRGPRNYQRSDERIREDVCERLTRHREIDASDVDIEVRSGVVTLTGQVEDKHAKRLAEDIAEEVMGVAEVRNELKASRGGMWGAHTGRGQGRPADERFEREVALDASTPTAPDTPARTEGSRGRGATSDG